MPSTPSNTLTKDFTPPFKAYTSKDAPSPLQSLSVAKPTQVFQSKHLSNQRRTSLTFTNQSLRTSGTSTRINLFNTRNDKASNTSPLLQKTNTNLQEQRKNPLVAKVAPVLSQPDATGPTSKEVIQTPPYLKPSTTFSRQSVSLLSDAVKPPGSSLITSMSLTTSQPHTITPSQSHTITPTQPHSSIPLSSPITPRVSVIGFGLLEAINIVFGTL